MALESSQLTMPASRTSDSPRLRRTRKELLSERVLSLIKGRRKPYTMPNHQAYSKLYFKKVRPIIKSNWKRESQRLKMEDRSLQDLGDKALTTALSGRKLAFTNKELKRLYAQESDEVKEEVEIFRRKYKSHSGNDKNIMNSLKPTMETLLMNIYQETGMYVTVIAAGYSGKVSKKSESVRFKSFHVGTNRYGANFADWHGKWEKSIKNKFIQFYLESRDCQNENAVQDARDASDYEEFNGMDDSFGELDLNGKVNYVHMDEFNDIARSPSPDDFAGIDDLRQVESAIQIDWNAMNDADVVMRDANGYNENNQPSPSSTGNFRHLMGERLKRHQKLPEHIRMLKTIVSGALDGRCLGIVEVWEKFEMSKGFPVNGGSLGKQSLIPAEVKEFLKHRDLLLVNIPEDPVEYGGRWTAWWRALQPSWRLQESPEAPLKDQNYIPKRPNWKSLAIAGQCGIITAIIGLAIWSLAIRRSPRNRKAGKDLERNLQDVDLVLQMMTVNWRDD